MVSHDPVCMIGLHIFFTIASRKGISISGVLCETDILAGENLGQPRVGRVALKTLAARSLSRASFSGAA